MEVRGGLRSSSPAPSGAASRTVTFTIPKVPRSRNANRAHVAFGRSAGASRHGTTMEWRRLGELYGSQAMIAARWPRAEAGQRFRVVIVMHRVWPALDLDNKYGAVKDLVDSMKRWHRVRVPAPGGHRYVPVDGLGLIFDDSEADIDEEVSQIRVASRAGEKTVVTVTSLAPA